MSERRSVAKRSSRSRNGKAKKVSSNINVPDLQGSWHLIVKNRNWFHPLEGTVRISWDEAVFLLSADLYGAHAKRLRIRNNWYPDFLKSHYHSYLRSTSVTQKNNTWTFVVNNFKWENSAFNSPASGTLALSIAKDGILAKRLEGSLKINGNEAMDVVLTRTSILFRGGRVGIDNRVKGGIEMGWNCKNHFISLIRVFQDHGIDLHIYTMTWKSYLEAFIVRLVKERGIANWVRHWRMLLIVATKAKKGIYGEMTDTAYPARQVAHVYPQVALPDSNSVHPNARGLKLGQVDLAFLRTTAHEIGHLFNLQHRNVEHQAPWPKWSLMYPTEDITNLQNNGWYPCNADFSFEDTERLSLIHDPDPQVAPGWMAFKWNYRTQIQGARPQATTHPTTITAPTAKPAAASVSPPNRNN